MTRDDIFKQVQDIFRDIFDQEDLVLKNKTDSTDIEEWDSLNHINLVNSIEQEFDIKFGLNELLDLENVGVMVELIFDKLH